MTVISALLGPPLNATYDPTPLYFRVQERIMAAIEADHLKPAEALPGERDIAEALGISRVTVRKAIAGLVDKGVLTQRQGSGTFVNGRQQRMEQRLSRLTSFTEDMRLRGLTPSTRWLNRDVSLPTPEEAMRLSLSPSETVVRLKRLRLANDVPMAIETAVIPSRHLPNPEAIVHSLYDVLEANGSLPVRALQRLRAAILSPAEAALLDVPPGSPALAIDRLSYLDNGTPIEFTRSTYRGDTYDFVAELNLRRE